MRRQPDALAQRAGKDLGVDGQLRSSGANPLAAAVADLLNTLDGARVRMYDRVLLAAAVRAVLVAAEGRCAQVVAQCLAPERDASLGDASLHIQDPGPEGWGEEPLSEEHADRMFAQWQDPTEMAARCRREELRRGMRLSPAGMYAVVLRGRPRHLRKHQVEDLGEQLVRHGAGAGAQHVPLLAWKQHGEGSPEHVAALEVWQDAKKHRQQVFKQGLSAWRFDALADLAERGTLAAHDGAPLTAKDREVLPVVVVNVQTAIGLADDPGELRGYSTLPAPVLHDLTAAAKSWLVDLVDCTGQALSVQRYKPTAAIRDWLIATKPTCVAPWCDSPVEWAEDDHLDEWRPPPDPNDPDSKPAGRPTSTDNLHPECKTTHRLKTAEHLDVMRDDDGAHRVITQSGHEYRRAPHRLLPEIGQGWGTTGDPEDAPPF